MNRQLFTIVCVGISIIFSKTSFAQKPLMQHHRHTDGTMNWNSYNTAEQYYKMQQSFNQYSGRSYNVTDYAALGRKADEENKAARELKARTIEVAREGKSWFSDPLVLDYVPQAINRHPGSYFISKTGKWGIYNKSQRKLIADAAYRYVATIGKKNFLVETATQTGLLDMEGNWRAPLGKYLHITEGGDLFLVKSTNGKFGLINAAGEELLAPEYKHGYTDQFFAILTNSSGNKELANASGKITLTAKEIIVVQRNLVIAATSDKSFHFADPRTGATTGGPYDYLGYFRHNQFILALKNKKYSILNTNGQPRFNTAYDNVLESKDSTIYLTVAGDKKGVLDISLEGHVTEALLPEYDDIYHIDRLRGVADVKLKGERKEVPVSMYYGLKSISPFKGNIARAFNGTDYYYINSKGLRLGENYYEEASEVLYDKFMGYYGIVSMKGKKGYWFFNSHNNNLQKQIGYEDALEIGSLNNNSNSAYAPVKISGKWGILQFTKSDRYSNGTFTHFGDFALAAKYEEIIPDPEGLVFIREKNKWGALSWPSHSFIKAETVIPVRYDSIRKSHQSYIGSPALIYQAFMGKNASYFNTYKAINKNYLEKNVGTSSLWRRITR